jgi:hypothetical protein
MGIHIFGLKHWETVAEAVYLCAIELIINVCVVWSVPACHTFTSVYP